MRMMKVDVELSTDRVGDESDVAARPAAARSSPSALARARQTAHVKKQTVEEHDAAFNPDLNVNASALQWLASRESDGGVIRSVTPPAMGNEKSRPATKTPTAVVDPERGTAAANKAGVLLQRKASVGSMMVPNAVQRLKSGPGRGIPIQTLSPDADGDGTVEEWELDVFNRIQAGDTDGDGILTTKELYIVLQKAIKEMGSELDEYKKGIPIKRLDPDLDGDGKVEPWEKDVYDRLKAADVDDSGSVSAKELFLVIKKAAETDKQKRRLAKGLALALGLIVLLMVLMGAMMAVMLDAFKDTQASSSAGGATLMTRTGNVIHTAPALTPLELIAAPVLTTEQASLSAHVPQPAAPLIPPLSPLSQPLSLHPAPLPSASPSPLSPPLCTAVLSLRTILTTL